MEIGIGLPATIPGVTGETLLAWARQADARGFSSLAVIDRLVYPSLEPLIALAAAAAVTSRIRLLTAVLIAPLRTNTALLAKQVASVDVISGGRLVLGVGLGGRGDDYDASGIETRGRGRALDQQIDELKRLWAGETLGSGESVVPEPSRREGPPIVVGGTSDRTVERVARVADGWMAGAGRPEAYVGTEDRVRRAWTAAGRQGSPRLLAQRYVGLGPDRVEHARTVIGRYYGFLGGDAAAPEDNALLSAEAVRACIDDHTQRGFDELVLLPTVTDVDEIDRIADVALGSGD